MNPIQHPDAAGRRLITSAEYKARRGGISEMTRWREEAAGLGARPVKVGRRNFYFEDEVDAFLSALATARDQSSELAVGEGDTQDEAVQPITGRGIGYKLFTKGLIPSMATREMQRVYRLLKEARERGIIPWNWIVDETRDIERTPCWDDPEQFTRVVARSYRRDFWNQQPLRIEIWSEKGTVRGVLAPVLEEFAVGFRVMHGFSGATTLHDVAQDDDGRPIIVLYVGDYDPSGLLMSERDLPERLAKYGGGHVQLKRVALCQRDLAGLPSFPASDKHKDPRYAWFVKSFGHRCWELDAMDPNDLRARVEQEIVALIEPTAWQRCVRVNAAEQESLRNVLAAWRAAT